MIDLMIRLIKALFGKYHRENSMISGFTGAIKDKKDVRDYVITSVGVEVPDNVSLRGYVKEIKSQGSINSCSAHAVCSAIEVMLNIDNPVRYIQLSEKYNYYYSRQRSNLFPQDSGSYLREAIKSAQLDGITTELLHPYNNDINENPSMVAKSISNIYGKSIFQYYRVYSNESIKQQLSMMKPVIISVPVYEYWINNKSGNIRLPTSNDKKIGHHAILITGFNDGYFEVLNSWSSLWGDSGFCNLPMNYVRNDAWVIELKG